MSFRHPPGGPQILYHSRMLFYYITIGDVSQLEPLELLDSLHLHVPLDSSVLRICQLSGASSKRRKAHSALFPAI